MVSSSDVYLSAPDLAAGADAVLLEWQVEEGEQVRLGQAVGEILDANGTTSLLAPCAGVLVEHQVDPGDVVATGQRLARFVTAATRSGNAPPADRGG